VPLLEAGLETITRLWAGETLDGSGALYPRPGARLSVLPAQQPRPPIWIGAIVPAAIERAAAQADGWVASANASIPELAEKIALYKAAARKAGTRGDVVVMRDGFVAESADEARRIVAEPMLGLYAEYAGWKRDSPDASKYSTLTFESLEPKLIFGTPDDAVRQLRAYRDLGVDQVILRMQYPGLAQADLLRCLTLFAAEVIPRVNAEISA
jgi:alkanesulfonate monooxygenase SsuD/methylene tetrahydromethanopterin reductase-like flavin-dependent oxidoreductase (luciferase family)